MKSLKISASKKYFQTYPWMRSYLSALERCRPKNKKLYKLYSGRGIKVLMTASDFKFLWIRDKAHLMDIPTIDRIDSDGHYELGNCRYLEKSINCYNGYSKQFRSVKQYDLKGRFIKDFKCISDAARSIRKPKNEVKYVVTNIIEVCRGKRDTAFGFKWKYNPSPNEGEK